VKLPLTYESTAVYEKFDRDEVRDADLSLIWEQFDNRDGVIGRSLIKKLVSYANAYHKIKQVVDSYRSSSPHVNQEGFVADLTGRFQEVLNIVAELDPK
jgi:hypothetical protein